MCTIAIGIDDDDEGLRNGRHTLPLLDMMNLGLETPKDLGLVKRRDVYRWRAARVRVRASMMTMCVGTEYECVVCIYDQDTVIDCRVGRYSC